MSVFLAQAHLFYLIILMYKNLCCKDLLMQTFDMCSSSGSDLSSAEGLPGPYADPGPSGAGQRHWPAGAPLPAAERLTPVPGPTGGAVPQAHVPLLTLWGSWSPTPTFSLTYPGLEPGPAPGSNLSSTQANGRWAPASGPGQHGAARVFMAGQQVWLTDTAWSRTWEKHFSSESKAACKHYSSHLSSVWADFWLASCNILWDSSQNNTSWCISSDKRKPIFYVTI